MFSGVELVASRAIAANICTISPPTPVSSTRRSYDYDWKSGMKTGDIVYIQSSAIPDWIRRHLPLIPVSIRFVLVSGDCDETVPDDIFRSNADFLQFISDSRIIHWFSQNADPNRHPKLSVIPIGLDYHTLAPSAGTGTGTIQHQWGPKATPEQQEHLLLQIAKKAPVFSDRKIACYSNFHFSITGRKFAADRLECLQAIGRSPYRDSLFFFEPEQCPRFNTWVNQAKYQFVLSPFGGGYDCHRTWEAIALGCVPIIRTSILDPLFEGLPVLIVKSWDDITPELLTETFDHRQTNKLYLNYWKEIIEQKK